MRRLSNRAGTAACLAISVASIIALSEKTGTSLTSGRRRRKFMKTRRGITNIPHLIWEKSRFLTVVLRCFLVVIQLSFVKNGKRDRSLRYGFEISLLTAFGNSVAGMQTLGASGACHMGATFLKHNYWPSGNHETRTVYIPAETWGKIQL